MKELLGSEFTNRKAIAISWLTEDGTHEIEIATGWPAGMEVDVAGVFCTLSASAGGAATWRVRISATTGWTPGDASEHYTSAVTAVADRLIDSRPNSPGMFTLPASGKLFARVIPNAGTTTGSGTVYVRSV